jgi:hypothetical protein
MAHAEIISRPQSGVGAGGWLVWGCPVGLFTSSALERFSEGLSISLANCVHL